jgi:hypothetical protein
MERQVFLRLVEVPFQGTTLKFIGRDASDSLDRLLAV